MSAPEIAVLVTFSASWCQPCQMFKPSLNEVAYRLANESLLITTIDCGVHGVACQRQNVPHYPYTLVYGLRHQAQPLQIESRDADEIVGLLRQQLRLALAVEPSGPQRHEEL